MDHRVVDRPMLHITSMPSRSALIGRAVKFTLKPKPDALINGRVGIGSRKPDRLLSFALRTVSRHRGHAAAGDEVRSTGDLELLEGSANAC